MTKKVFSICLSLVLMLSLFMVPAMAEEGSHADLDFAKALGFVPENAQAEKVITRIELAEIFYNIVFPQKMSEGEFSEMSIFTDVPAEKAHIAALSFDMGIMRGYGNGLFGANDSVTYAQAVKCMVSFLGYDLQADLLGGYPGGYFSQAVRLKILPENGASGDMLVTYGAVCSMLKLAIGKDIAVWDNISGDRAQVKVLEGVDYLLHYRGVKFLNGVVEGNYLTNIKGEEKTNYFCVDIDSVQMVVDASAAGIQELLGQNVCVYYSEEEGYKQIKYYEAGKNNILEISANELAFVSGNTVKYYGGDTMLEASFDKTAHLIYNGTYEPIYKAEDLNPFGKGYDGSIKLIDTNLDGQYDNIVLTAFKTVIVNDIIQNKVYGVYGTTAQEKVVDLTHYKERNINIRNILGEIMDVEGLRKGDILNICADKKGVVKEIIVSKDTMSGVIEEISYSGSKIYEITVGGTVFKASNNIKVIDYAGKMAPGIAAEIFFDCMMNVTLIDLENKYFEGFMAGYIVDAGTEGNLQKSAKCMLFGEDGIMHTFDMPEKMRLNGNAADFEDVINAFGKEGSRVKRQFVLYKTDADNKMITAVEIPVHLTDDRYAFDGIYQLPGDDAYYHGGHYMFNSKYVSSKSVVAFAVPDETYRDKYDKYTISALPVGEGVKIGNAGAKANMQLFGTKKEAMEVEFVVMSSSSASSDTSTRPLFAVSKVTTAIDEEGEVGIKVFGMMIEGTTLTSAGFFIEEQLIKDGHNSGSTSDPNNGKKPFINQSETAISPGDIFRFPSFIQTGKITSMDITQFYQLYDYGDKAFVAPLGTDGNEFSAHVFGTAVSKTDSALKIRLLDGSERTFRIDSYAKVKISNAPATGEVFVENGSMGDIYTEETHPGKASKILLHYRGIGIGLFIIND